MPATMAGHEPARPIVDPSLASAYAACEQLARAHYENFPVASWLLPAAMRPHVAALYAFARTADDFADEGERPPIERHRLLDGWLERLRRCGAEDGGRLASTREGAPQHAALFRALGHTIRTCALPLSPFEDLLSAFRQDIMTKRYATWDDLLDYCRRSANPVGRLVLRIAGFRSDELDRRSDALCTALQLTNFWQDLARDWRRGRLYVPQEIYVSCGAVEADLDRGHLSSAWRRALRQVVDRTRTLFHEGRPVTDAVGGRLKLELRLTWLGGTLILDRVERADFDMFHRRPALQAWDIAPLLYQAVLWRSPIRNRENSVSLL